MGARRRKAIMQRLRRISSGRRWSIGFGSLTASGRCRDGEKITYEVESDLSAAALPTWSYRLVKKAQGPARGAREEEDFDARRRPGCYGWHHTRLCPCPSGVVAADGTRRAH